ncbi:UNVERIFIED_CONTAM: hypothetical protein Sradi_3164500 [Sesamum radiatum]|uniref:Transmembrane protein n=1 Tax=Sesamum radiatum TaxID=300843 RepID=A0AAW2REI3_SESRA
MLNAVRLQVSNPARPICSCGRNGAVASSHRQLGVRLPTRRHFASFTVRSSENVSSEPSASSQLTSAIGSSSALQPSQWTLTHRHIHFLSYIACAAAISATWLFCSAIPTLLAFKRAAESLEKLMDATREELPDTMAAVRLSGMEISDLTMELSDLGQEITQGVRSSTRAVRLAEERLRRLTNMNPIDIDFVSTIYAYFLWNAEQESKQAVDSRVDLNEYPFCVNLCLLRKSATIGDFISVPTQDMLIGLHHF